MTDLIKQVTEYKEFAKDFFEWYKDTYAIPLVGFIKLPQLMQLPILQHYIIEYYNIAVHYDIGSVVIYWYNPEKNIKEIEIRSKELNKFTFNIKEDFDLEAVNFENSYKRAILKALKLINEPF
jgi:hypothetical protein